MNKILDQIGQYREIEIEDVNGGSPRMATCLEACTDQQNEVAITTSRLPNRQTMLQWSDFCVVMEKIIKSCGHVWKRIDMDRQYPSLCQLLLTKLNRQSLSFNSDNKKLCQQVIKGFNILGAVDDFTQDAGNSSDDALVSALFTYARENLALVNIYIKPPVVTRIKKDQRIPVIWFVANCGGILGLCMGFSIVTMFEVLHYICRLIFHACSRFVLSRKSPNNQTHCRRSDTENTFVKQSVCNIVDNTEMDQR